MISVDLLFLLGGGWSQGGAEHREATEEFEGSGKAGGGKGSKYSHTQRNQPPLSIVLQ